MSSSESSDEEVIMELLQHLPRPRTFRDRSNPLEDFDDVDFKCRFRLSKDTFMAVLEVIGPRIEKLTSRSMAVSSSNQLLIALRYYASGAFQTVLGDHIRIHKSTVCRIIKSVTISIARLRETFIYMPEEKTRLKEDFFEIRGFPNVIGAIDCSHMKIESPGGRLSEMYRNRKGYFSINVQAVCTADLRIIDVVARWPGSVHDSTIFDACLLRAKFENNEYPNSFLLGDSGYPCRNYLMTPLLHPTTEAERNYQDSQIATRNSVERLFGVWKRRFPVLALGMRTKISTTLATIVATAVLHNIANDHNDNEPVCDIDIEDDDVPVDPIPHNGNAARTALINTVFARR